MFFNPSPLNSMPHTLHPNRSPLRPTPYTRASVVQKMASLVFARFTVYALGFFFSCPRAPRQGAGLEKTKCFFLFCFFAFVAQAMASLVFARFGACFLTPLPYTLHPTPYTLYPTPYTLHPTPLLLNMYLFSSKPGTQRRRPHQYRDSKTSTLNPRP